MPASTFIKGKNMKDFMISLVKNRSDLAIRSIRKTPAIINQHDNNNCTPLHHAVFEENENLVQLNLSYKPNLQAKDIYGNTALHFACEMESKRIVKLLIRSGGDPNIQNNDGISPLHIAAELNNLRIADLLITGGAMINIRDSSGKTPLTCAIDSDSDEISKFIQQYGGIT